MRWNGTGWTSKHSATSVENLNAGWASDKRNAWALGINGTFLRGDGVRWSVVDLGTTTSYTGIWGADADNVWAVGEGGAILKWEHAALRSVGKCCSAGAGEAGGNGSFPFIPWPGPRCDPAA